MARRGRKRQLDVDVEARYWRRLLTCGVEAIQGVWCRGCSRSVCHADLTNRSSACSGVSWPPSRSMGLEPQRVLRYYTGRPEGIRTMRRLSPDLSSVWTRPTERAKSSIVLSRSCCLGRPRPCRDIHSRNGATGR